LDESAAAYSAELARFGTDEHAWPSFAVCFLGVGPDGHIASLFPDRAEVTVTDAAALPVRNSPKPPAERVTLTRPVLNASKRVWLVLTGADKASALGLALAGASYASVPAAGAEGRRRTVVFVDDAAAAEVAPELIALDYWVSGAPGSVEGSRVPGFSTWGAALVERGRGSDEVDSSLPLRIPSS